MSDFKGRVNMGPYSTPEIVSDLSRDDVCLYMTDAWVEPHGVQNPAIYDCFPKFLKCSLNGTGDTMPRTIRKMTGGVADRFSIPEQGDTSAKAISPTLPYSTKISLKPEKRIADIPSA